MKPRRHVAGGILGVLLGGFALVTAPFSAISIGAVALLAPSLSAITSIGALVTLVCNLVLLVGSIMVLAGYGPQVARVALWSLIGWAAIASAVVLPALYAISDAQVRASAMGAFIGSMVVAVLLNGVLLVLFRGDPPTGTVDEQLAIGDVS